jgi:hypothetical protein
MVAIVAMVARQVLESVIVDGSATLIILKLYYISWSCSVWELFASNWHQVEDHHYHSLTWIIILTRQPIILQIHRAQGGSTTSIVFRMSLTPLISMLLITE